MPKLLRENVKKMEDKNCSERKESGKKAKNHAWASERKLNQNRKLFAKRNFVCLAIQIWHRTSSLQLEDFWIFGESYKFKGITISADFWLDSRRIHEISEISTIYH